MFGFSVWSSQCHSFKSYSAIFGTWKLNHECLYEWLIQKHGCFPFLPLVLSFWRTVYPFFIALIQQCIYCLRNHNRLYPTLLSYETCNIHFHRIYKLNEELKMSQGGSFQVIPFSPRGLSNFYCHCVIKSTAKSITILANFWEVTTTISLFREKRDLWSISSIKEAKHQSRDFKVHHIILNCDCNLIRRRIKKEISNISENQQQKGKANKCIKFSLQNPQK